MRIAICDADMQFMDQLEEMLGITCLNHTCDKYEDWNHLWRALWAKNIYDLIFMAIEWEQVEENGIDYAARINVQYPEIQIVFMTSCNDRFSQEIFWQKVNLCGYLVKPIILYNLQMVMDKVENTITRCSKTKISVQYKGVTENIPFENILYLESSGHRLLIHCKETVINVYEKLDDYERKMQENFVRIHKSYLINMDYIRRLERREVLLENGKVLPVSKSKYSNVKETFEAFLLARGQNVENEENL